MNSEYTMKMRLLDVNGKKIDKDDKRTQVKRVLLSYIPANVTDLYSTADVVERIETKGYNMSLFANGAQFSKQFTYADNGLSKDDTPRIYLDVVSEKVDTDIDFPSA